MATREQPDDDATRESAAERLARRDGGWTAAEAAEFARWRAANPRHEAAVQRLGAAQRLLRRLPESPAAVQMLAELEGLSRPRRRLVRLRPWMMAAGVLAAAACVAFAVWSRAPRPHSTVTFATAAGQHRTVDLTDGSTLLLNSGSEVDVEYRANERRINLHQGEVHCSVAKDASRPFVVAAGFVRVRAVGTAFNVRRDRAAIEVLVTEGRVDVSRDGGPSASVAPAGPLLLRAGESVVIDADPAAPLPAVGRLAPEDFRAKLAWHASRLVFDNTPLAEVVTRFNRYSRMQLEIGDPELAGRPVGGTFDADNAEAFANLLLASGDVRLERVSDTRIILHKAR